jgi:hypothetical protein
MRKNLMRALVGTTALLAALPAWAEQAAHGAEEAGGYPVLTAGIKAASRLAIWLSTRV